jgi:hypothetical protein
MFPFIQNFRKCKHQAGCAGECLYSQLQRKMPEEHQFKTSLGYTKNPFQKKSEN